MQILKIGHAEFETPDVYKMASYYSEVVGLNITHEDAEVVYLASTLDHHSLVIRKGAQKRLSALGFQVARDSDHEALIGELKSHGCRAEMRQDAEPGLGKLVVTEDPGGVEIKLYSQAEIEPYPYLGRGVMPLKLSHVAMLAEDLPKSVDFYMKVLGFRFSDSMKKFFYFLRCGADHHTINLLAGNYNAVQHIAFELTDVAHIRTACDTLAHHHVPLVWGPLRHGIGHNIACYHFDPDEHLIEFAAELDRMSNEGLGYFDPRPYHTDFPQRPKEWTDVDAATNLWGPGPPAAFGKGLNKVAMALD